MNDAKITTDLNIERPADEAVSPLRFSRERRSFRVPYLRFLGFLLPLLSVFRQKETERMMHRSWNFQCSLRCAEIDSDYRFVNRAHDSILY